MSETTFEDGRRGFFVNFADGTNHNFYYSFIVENSYNTDTVNVVNAQSGETETLQRCINEIVNLEFLNMRSTDLQRDSAGWHAYSLIHVYSGRLSEGPNNGFTYEVNIPVVWVWKGDPEIEPEYPDKPTPIVWEDGDEGFDYVNDSTSQSWKDIIPTLSDGTKGKPDRIAVLLKNTIIEPEYQIKTVEDFEWSNLEMVPYDEVKAGDRYDKENKISVQPYMKSVKPRTNKCDAIFILKREGAPIYTDSLGGKHYLPERSWTAKDDGWNDKKLDPSDNYERLLLTSRIIGTFNEHSHPAKGEVELKKVKGEDIKIIGYSYPEDEKGIEAIVPNESYKTWRNQYTVFSTGKKEFNQKVSTTLYLKTIAPQKQTVTVTDWDINDLAAQDYKASRGESRKDKQETGTFTIYSWSKNYVTRTNKSEDKFVTTYDGTVKFVDKYENEVEFISLAVKQEDLGGTATLKPLNEENDYERKLMTTSIKVTETNTSNSADFSAEVLFQKAIEKEELLDWTVTKDLIDKGNGLWDTKADIVYTWKLKGTEHDPITQELDCSFKGEQKSHVILDKAEAPFNASNFNSAWSAETTSTPQQYVTLYTKTKSVSEDYTTLTDRYTAQMQRAVIKKTVAGKEIVVEMLAPSDMTFSHNEGNLVDGKRTTSEAGVTYDVYDHTGSVTATVTGNGKSQTQSAKDEKEIWVKHEDPAPKVECKFGFIDANLVFNPNASTGGQGAFHVCITIKGENEWINAITRTFGSPNASDFETYRFPFSEVPENLRINSALYSPSQKRWVPAWLSGIGQEWTYWSYDDIEFVNMNMNEATTCGIKNFTGAHTAENTARLNYSYRITDDGTLHVYNHMGGEVYSIK